MSKPDRTVKKVCGHQLRSNQGPASAGKAVTGSGKSAAGTGVSRITKPALGRSTGKGPVYETPKPVQPRRVKK